MKNYWFTLRVKGGALLARGPFEYEECKRQREKAKAPDFEVSAPILAESEQEALDRAHLFMP